MTAEENMPEHHQDTMRIRTDTCRITTNKKLFSTHYRIPTRFYQCLRPTTFMFMPPPYPHDYPEPRTYYIVLAQKNKTPRHPTTHTHAPPTAHSMPPTPNWKLPTTLNLPSSSFPPTYGQRSAPSLAFTEYGIWCRISSNHDGLKRLSKYQR